jgi:hypothetical protein
MKDVRVKTGFRCPICERGKLVEVGFELWQCERDRCNNEFFYDEFESGSGKFCLNARDKPRKPNIVVERYRLYRSYGHSVFIAASLAPPPEWIAMLMAILTGFAIGIILYDL